MKGYNYAEKPLITLSIFDQISQPDTISYLIAINACAQIAMLRRAKSLYQQICKNFPSYQADIRIMNALITMFGKVTKYINSNSNIFLFVCFSLLMS